MGDDESYGKYLKKIRCYVANFLLFRRILIKCITYCRNIKVQIWFKFGDKIVSIKCFSKTISRRPSKEPDFYVMLDDIEICSEQLYSMKSNLCMCITVVVNNE